MKFIILTNFKMTFNKEKGGALHKKKERNNQLNISSIEYGGIRTFWAQKIRLEKFTKSINIFELYQDFLLQVSTYSNLRVLTNFGLGVSGHFGDKRSEKFKKILNYIKSSCIIVCTKMLFFFIFLVFWNASIFFKCLFIIQCFF